MATPKPTQRVDIHLRLPRAGYDALRRRAVDDGVSLNTAAWFALRRGLGLVSNSFAIAAELLEMDDAPSPMIDAD
jgi:hypothetical protein